MKAKSLPVRPRPDWISSVISSTLVLATDRGCLLQKAFGRNDDPGLALNRFHQKGAGVGRNRLAQRVGIAERNDLESGRERPEAIAVLLVGGEADDGHRAAVEVVGADDDFGLAIGYALDLVAPLARRLDGGFDGFGAGVHGQRHVEAGQLVQVLQSSGSWSLRKAREVSVTLCACSTQRLQNLGMAVPLVDGRIGGEAVEITVSLDVINPDALGAFDDHIERMVVVGSIKIFEFDEFGGSQLFHDWHKGLPELALSN